MNSKNLNDNRGFLKLILLIIVVLVVASFMGYNPQVIWNDYIAKGLLFIWGLIVIVVNFFVGAISAGIGAFDFLTNLFGN